MKPRYSLATSRIRSSSIAARELGHRADRHSTQVNGIPRKRPPAPEGSACGDVSLEQVLHLIRHCLQSRDILDRDKLVLDGCEVAVAQPLQDAIDVDRRQAEIFT